MPQVAQTLPNQCTNFAEGRQRIRPAEYRLIRAKPRRGPCQQTSDSGSLVTYRVQIVVRVNTAPANRVSIDRLNILPKSIANCHLAHINSASGGEVNVPPRPRIDFD